MAGERRGLPWLTLIAVGVAFAATLVPGAAVRLEYDRFKVVNGEAWRLLTGQLVHWTGQMAVVDLSVVLILGAWIEWRSRRLLAAVCLAAALAVGPGLHLLAPSIATYRGMSGLGSALFVCAALVAWRDSEGRRVRQVALAALVLFLLKLLWETATGRTVAVNLPPGVVVAPLAHLLGAMAGIAAFLGVSAVPSRTLRTDDRGEGPVDRTGPGPASIRPTPSSPSGSRE